MRNLKRKAMAMKAKCAWRGRVCIECGKYFLSETVSKKRKESRELTGQNMLFVAQRGVKGTPYHEILLWSKYHKRVGLLGLPRKFSCAHHYSQSKWVRMGDHTMSTWAKPPGMRAFWTWISYPHQCRMNQHEYLGLNYCAHLKLTWYPIITALSTRLPWGCGRVRIFPKRRSFVDLKYRRSWWKKKLADFYQKL